MAPRISVVIPAHNEGAIIAAAVAAVLAQSPHEVIVAPGESTDATAQLAERAGAQVVPSARGRARQMNAGAAAASGDVLLFLHADVRLPEGGLDAVRRVMADGAGADPAVVGGAFRLRLDSPRWSLRAIAWLSNLRSEISRVQMGDRAIFVRGSVFRDLPKIPELLRQGEDVYVIVGNGTVDYLYRVTDFQILSADALKLYDTGQPSVFLVTCIPRFYYDYRLVVKAELAGTRAAAF